MKLHQWGRHERLLSLDHDHNYLYDEYFDYGVSDGVYDGADDDEI